MKKSPADFPAGLSIKARGSFRSVADLDAAEAPAVTVPEALADQAAGRGRVFHIDRATVGRAARGDCAADDRAAEEARCDTNANATLCAGRGRCQRTRKRCNRD